MSIGSFGGVLGSAAGAPLPQAQGSQERAAADAATVERQATQDRKADAAAGVGEAAEDQQSGDRDADGRRLWEPPPEKSTAAREQEAPPSPSKDATGTAGNTLDMTG